MSTKSISKLAEQLCHHKGRKSIQHYCWTMENDSDWVVEGGGKIEFLCSVLVKFSIEHNSVGFFVLCLRELAFSSPNSTYSQIDGPFGWKPCKAFVVFARARSVSTVRFVGLLIFLVQRSGRFRPKEPAEITIN